MDKMAPDDPAADNGAENPTGNHAPTVPPENEPPVDDQQERYVKERLDEKSARTWAMFCHLAGLLLFSSIPFANILGPLVIWLIKKEEHPFIDEQGKEALNFQITMSIAMLLAGMSIFILVGIVLLPLVVLVDAIFVVIASIKANEGDNYKYPFSFQFVV